MYSAIKGDDKFGERMPQSTIMPQIDSSGLVFCDKREVLLDFTLRDTSSDEKNDTTSKIKFQSQFRNNMQKSPKSKDPKFQLYQENSALNLSDEYYKERMEITYSQRENELVKDLSNQFAVVSRAGVREEDLRIEPPLEFNNSDRGGALEDSQMKEIFSNLMLRKDAESEKLLLKQFENSSLFISNNGVVLQGSKPALTTFPLSYFEKNIINGNLGGSETSLCLSTKPLQGQLLRMNSTHSGENPAKKPSLNSDKQEGRNYIKNSFIGPEISEEQGRPSNKTSSSLLFFQGHPETKLVPPVTFEENRLKDSLYFQDNTKDLSASHLSQSKQKCSDNSASLIADLRFTQFKNSASFSNEEIRIGEEALSAPSSEDNTKIRDPQSPYCASFEERDITSVAHMYNSHGQLRLKHMPQSTTEEVCAKNMSTYFVSMGQDIIKNVSCYENGNISLTRDQIKMMASSSFGQGSSVLIKNSQVPLDDEELYQAKLPHVSFALDQGHNIGRKKLYVNSTGHLESPSKSDSSILEKALNVIQEGTSNAKKIHSSDSSLRNIIQDLSAIKSLQMSQCDSAAKTITSCPLVPHLKRSDAIHTKAVSDESKIKNFSYPIYDDGQKLLSDMKHLRTNSFNLGDNNMAFNLKDAASVLSSNLSSQPSESFNFPSDLRLGQEGAYVAIKTISTAVQNYPLNKASSENHPSVIAQVGMSCKVCDMCRKTYLEKGFLNADVSCSVCLYHAKNGMKCVCDNSFLKEETCTCKEEKYECSYCDKVFPSILLLQRHTFHHISDEDDQFATSDNNELFSCNVCGQSFQQVTTLDEHIASHKEGYCNNCDRTFKQFNPTRHSCNAKYICSLCGAGFVSNYNLKMHLLKHSGCLPYKCQECSKSFAKPSELSKHSLVHSGERPYSCDECVMTFTSATYLRAHKSTHAGRKPHSCYICNKSFTRPADVKRHMVIHTGARPYACELCGLAFADASNMRKHLSTHSKPHQGSDIKTYHCTYCGKMFARPSELKRHFFTHTNTRPYACHICGLAFTDSSNLKKHIQTHERASEHLCIRCESNFKTFSELEMHISISHGAKRFDANSGHHCQTCGATFSQLVDLQDHVLSHGASPTFRCEICSKNFCEQAFLVRHILTHTEERPFVCNECSRSFKSLSHLRSHLLIHTGEKIHVCSKCNKSFLKKSSLLRHQGVHAREKVLAMYQLG